MKPSLQVAGGLGLGGVSLGLAILIATCAGLDAALDFSPAVILLGLGALGLTLFATLQKSDRGDSATLAGLFLALLCITGGLLEMAVWLHWPILFNQPM